MLHCELPASSPEDVRREFNTLDRKKRGLPQSPVIPSDLDECAHNNGGCKENCHNEVGTGYKCSCQPRYILKDGYRCEPCEPFHAKSTSFLQAFLHTFHHLFRTHFTSFSTHILQFHTHTSHTHNDFLSISVYGCADSGLICDRQTCNGTGCSPKTLQYCDNVSNTTPHCQVRDI